MTSKPSRKPKQYRSKIHILDNGHLQGRCECGWAQPMAVVPTDLSLAMATVQSEIQAHKHIPKPAKKAGKKKVEPCCGNMHSARCYNCPLEKK